MTYKILKSLAALSAAVIMLSGCACLGTLGGKTDTETGSISDDDMYKIDDKAFFDIQDSKTTIYSYTDYSNPELPDSVTLFLNDNGYFQCSEGYLSSHFSIGTWSIEGDILTAVDTECEITYRFKIDGNDLLYISEGSGKFLFPSVTDGDRFVCVSAKNIPDSDGQ